MKIPINLLPTILLAFWGVVASCFAQDLQDIPEKILQLQESTSTITEITSDYTEIQAPTTDTTTINSTLFLSPAASGTASGYIKFSGPTGATQQTTIHIKKMEINQAFDSTVDLNGVNLTIGNMSNDLYETKSNPLVPSYKITNTSDVLSTLTITRSNYARGSAVNQNANRAAIEGNIQIVVKPVALEDFPGTATVPLEYRNMYDRLYLWGKNTYTGGTIVEGLANVGDGNHNTVLHATGESLGTGTLTLRNMATLMNGQVDVEFDNDIVLDKGGALRIGNGQTMVVNGDISGNGGLYLNYNEANGGNIVLTGNNTYEGDTHLCGFLPTTQEGPGDIYTVKIQSDTAFSGGTVVFDSESGGRQYTITLELDNPGGTRMIDNDIDLQSQKAIITKTKETESAIVAGQLHGNNVSVMVTDNVDFHIDLDNWVLPEDDEFLYMWDMTGNLTFNTETVFSLYSNDMSQYAGKKIYLAQTDNVTGRENITLNLDNAKGDGEWETGTDEKKGFYIQYKATPPAPPKPVETPEPGSGLLLLLALFWAFRRKRG